jgi:thioredoxin-like negative regulator of GroEL
LSYPHYFDGRGWQNAVAVRYRVRGIPQIYLLDSQLRIVAKNLRGAQLESKLRELLGPGDETADLKSQISDLAAASSRGGLPA